MSGRQATLGEERRAALFGPRNLKTPGSPEWCWQTLELLKLTYSHLDDRWRDVAAAYGDLAGVRAWEKVPPEKPYGSEDAMLRAELGLSAGELRSRLKRAQLLAEQSRGTEPLRESSGRPSTGEAATNGAYTHHLSKGSTHAGYLLARIKRDRPDIAARVEAGEFRSARQAAIAAGIIKDEPRVTIRPLPEAFASAAVRHLSEEQLWEMLGLIGDQLLSLPVPVETFAKWAIHQFQGDDARALINLLLEAHTQREAQFKRG